MRARFWAWVEGFWQFVGRDGAATASFAIRRAKAAQRRILGLPPIP